MRVPTLLMLCALTFTSARTSDLTETAEAIERTLADAERRGFSGAVVLTHGDETLVARGCGLADRDAAIPNTPATLFDCGSVSKQFVAAAILVLEERGALTVDDPISDFYPDAPDDVAGVTVHQLLAHTSGMVQTDDLYERHRSDPSDRAYLDGLLRAMPRRTRPGVSHRYNNMGYCLLAGIIEQVAAMPYEDAMHELVFAPAGLEHTACSGSAAIDRADCAFAYVEGRPPTAAIDLPTGWGHRGATGVVTSADDLVRWARVLRDGDLLSDTSRRLLWRPAAGGYALGWKVERVGPTHHHVHHGGATIGFDCHLDVYLHEDLVLVAWSNGVREVGRALIAEVRGLVGSAVRPQVVVPRTAVEFPKSGGPAEEVSWAIEDMLRRDLPGRWRLGDDDELIVEDDGDGGLTIRPEGLAACDLIYWNGWVSSSLAHWTQSADHARRVVQALAERDTDAIAAVLRDDEECPTAEALVARGHEIASRSLEGGARVVGTTWDYGKNPVVFEAADRTGDPLRFAILWDPYSDRLVDVQLDGWKALPVGRLASGSHGALRILRHAGDETTLGVALDRGDDGEIEALRLVVGEQTVALAHRLP